MERKVSEVLKDALALPPAARGALIDSLIESLDADVDEDAEEAWRVEIERRVQRLRDRLLAASC